MKEIIRKIVRSYKKLGAALLSKFADKVYTFTSASKALVNPVPTMPDLLAAITNFNTLLSASDKNSIVQAEEVRQARKILLDLLDQLADWVTLTARTDAAILASSGFDLNKIPSPRHIATPQNVRVGDGPNAGQLTLECDAVEFAVSYIHQYSTDPDMAEGSWVSQASSSKAFTFTGLAIGKMHFCRIIAVGTKKAIRISNVVSRNCTVIINNSFLSSRTTFLKSHPQGGFFVGLNHG